MEYNNSDDIFTHDKSRTIVCGKGEPLVFLHGYLSSKEAFSAQIAFFSRYYKVYAPDLTGFGKNVPMPYAYDLDDYVREFSQLLKSIGKPVCVVAHSFGCRIAIKAMSEGLPVKKAVLCGVAGLKPRFSLKKTLKKRIYRAVRPFFNKEHLEKRFFSSDYNMLDGVMKESFKKIVGEYLDDRLETIKCPVLCVFGSNDRDTPPYLAERIRKKLPSVRVEFIADAGHFCFSEKSAEFNYRVREFLL